VSVLIAAALVTGCGGAAGGQPRHRFTAAAAAGLCREHPAVPSDGAGGRYDRQVLAYGPVMYLAMGSPSTGVADDLSGNRHRGTYLPAGGHPATARLPDGELAAAFNGHGQYLDVPSAPDLSVTHTGCLTVQAWVWPATLQFPDEEGSGYVYVLGKGTSGKQEYALRMYSLDNTEVPERPNRMSAYVFNLGGGLGSGAYFQDRLLPHAWMMVTFVIDDRPSAAWPDGYIAIYKNDELRGQVSIGQFDVTPKASTAPFRVATRQLISYFDGAIGKVAVFDYALSGQQVAAVYNAMP
jgi:hypothetical protein